MNKYKFAVIVCCQGQQFYYFYKSLIGALIGYAKQYLKKKKYKTMNFTLEQCKMLNFNKIKNDEIKRGKNVE